MFTLEQARALMPELLRHADEFVAVRADLTELVYALRFEEPTHLGGLAEAKAMEAHVDELTSWFTNQGLEVKGLAPLLLDFPAELAGEPVLLCWLEGEPELRWYHHREHGFAGRRRLPDD